MSGHAPAVARWLLHALLPERDREFIIGDLDEEYVLRRRTRSWYWRQAIATVWAEAGHAFRKDSGLDPGEPRGGSRVESVWQDVKYAWRSLNRRPLFTTIAVVTLALGIGANAGIFSIANWLLLQPVPGVGAAKDLAAVEFAKTPGNVAGVSWWNFIDLRAGMKTIDGMAGSAFTELQILIEDAPPLVLQGQAVGGDYFGVLRVRPRLGRLILAEETEPGRDAFVAVISEELWSGLFNRDPGVVGRTLHANQHKFTIVGVAADGFRGTERIGQIDIWVPFGVYAQLNHFDTKLYAERGTGMRMRELFVRMRPDATVESVESDAARVMAGLMAAYPEENDVFEDNPAHVYRGIGMAVISRERTRQTVRLMLVMVGVLLVISSANVANMLLVRGAQQRPDAALRRTLGASARRLVTLQVTECFILALLGGALALFVARAFLEIVKGGRLAGLPPIDNVPLDVRVLVFTFIVSLVTGFLFALAPLSVMRRLDLNAELHGGSGRLTPRTAGFRGAVTVVQVALSMVLLVGALLMGRTLRNLQRIDLGFDPTRVVGIYLRPYQQGYVSEQLPAFRARVLEQFRARPEIEAAALSYTVALSGATYMSRVVDPLGRSDEPIEANGNFVSDGYFAAMGIPIVRGRPIEARDWTTDTMVTRVVISETAAERLFAGNDPIGQSLFTARAKPDELVVVGVAADTRLGSLDDPPGIVIYQPLHGLPSRQVSVVVRPRGSVAAAEPVIRSALAAVDPALAMDYRPVTDNARRWISEQRLLGIMFALFSGVAVLLAGIGIYGVLAYQVNERRRELGIRMALGAQAPRVIALVAKRSALLVGVGLVLGLAAAVWLSRLIQSLLYGVDPVDPWTYAGAAVLFALIALIATAIPTRSATRVSPLIALRHE